MDLQLKGKTAFVSGSTQGIGFAIARQLLQEGATVTINGRTSQRVNEAVEKLALQVPGADVSEIANLVTYVASPLSSATNGAALRADGGVLKTIF